MSEHVPPLPPVPNAKDVAATNRTKAVAKKAREKLNKAKDFKSPYGHVPGKLLSIGELSDITGFGVTKIKNYEALGMPSLQLPGRKNGKRYNSSMVLDWVHRHEVKKAQDKIAVVEPEINHAKEMVEAQRRKAVGEAVLVELKVATEQGKVANVEDLMENFSEAIVNVRGALMSFKARLPGMLAHSTEEEVANILDSEVKEVLNNLVEYNHEYKEAQKD